LWHCVVISEDHAASVFTLKMADLWNTSSAQTNEDFVTLKNTWKIYKSSLRKWERIPLESRYFEKGNLCVRGMVPRYAGRFPAMSLNLQAVT